MVEKKADEGQQIHIASVKSKLDTQKIRSQIYRSRWKIPFSAKLLGQSTVADGIPSIKIAQESARVSLDFHHGHLLKSIVHCNRICLRTTAPSQPHTYDLSDCQKNRKILLERTVFDVSPPPWLRPITELTCFSGHSLNGVLSSLYHYTIPSLAVAS